MPAPIPPVASPAAPSPIPPVHTFIPQPEPALPQTALEPIPASHDHDLEFKFGSKAFTGVGVVAVILGVAFFLRYAFSQNLITETMRVVLGIVGGGILLGIGAYLRKTYASYANVLSGGGLALWYLSAYASFGVYSLVSFEVAFIGLVLTTAVGVVMAIAYDSLPLIAFAQVGGFLTPMLLSTHGNHPHELFLFAALLTIAMVAVAARKPWPHLIVGNLIGVLMVFLSWFSQYYTTGQFGVFFFYSTLFFFIFLATVVVYQMRHQTIKRAGNLTIALSVPVVYFLANLTLLHQAHPEYQMAFTLALGVLYAVLGIVFYELRNRDVTAQDFANSMFALALFFFVVTMPVAFDRWVITVGWALEALVVVVLGSLLKIRGFRIAGGMLFILAFLRFLGFDLFPADLVHAWTNVRATTAAILTLSLLLGAFVIRKIATEQQEEDATIFALLSVGAYLVPLVALTLEIQDFYNHSSLAILWSLMGLAAGMVSVHTRNMTLRLVSYITFVAAAIRIVGYDGHVDLATYSPVFNGRVGMTVLLSLCLGALLQFMRQQPDAISEDEKKTVVPVIFFGINLLLLWVVSVEVLDYFKSSNLERAMLSVAWTVYAILLLMFGIFTRSSFARSLSIALFGVVVFKVFLYDTTNLSDLYRFISFISLGIILLISGYLYYRYKDRIRSFITAQS